MQFRLITCDMDGTLLDNAKNISDDFWPLLGRLQEQGIIFAPASGRQLETILDMFEKAPNPVSVIAENGALVYHDGEIVSLTTIDKTATMRVLDAIAEHPEVGWEVTLCRADGAFVGHTNEEFARLTAMYYHKLNVVDDVRDYVNDDVIKLALFTRGDPEEVAETVLKDATGDDLAVVVSGTQSIDVIHQDINKGVGLQELATKVGVPLSQTLAFGDYLNDTELLAAAGTSYAMANGHPQLKAAADHIAPSNEENGVVRVLQQLLDS